MAINFLWQHSAPREKQSSDNSMEFRFLPKSRTKTASGECLDPLGEAPPQVASRGTTGGLQPLHTTTRHRSECGAKARWPNNPSHTPTGHVMLFEGILRHIAEQVRSGQVRSARNRLGGVKSCHVGSDQINSSQAKPGHIPS